MGGVYQFRIRVNELDSKFHELDFSLTISAPFGTLSVVSTSGLTSQGYEYGPFNPANKWYTLRNVGSTAINWTAGKSQAWTTLSATSGTLQPMGTPGDRRDINVTINANADSLVPGIYNDTITFNNTTNNFGNTSRGVALTVNSAQPAPGQDTQPGNEVTLDHLWQWDQNAGRFVQPPNNTVVINPNLPTYLLTHGWDGSLDGVGFGTPCSDPDPTYAMSSVGCAIAEYWENPNGTPGANLLAWDWESRANPNGECDFPDGLVDGLGETALTAVVDLIQKGPYSAGIGVILNGTTLAGSIILDARRSANRTFEEGNKLGKALADVIATQGSLGSQLHLIGKSHGGGVMGQAATILSSLGPAPTSLTTLDTPKFGCIGPINVRFFGTIPEVCLVNSHKNINPDAVPLPGGTTVIYYPDVTGGGFGAPVVGSHSSLVNMELNPDLVPNFSLLDPLNPQWIDHLWITGFDKDGCAANTGWFSPGVDHPVAFGGVTQADSVLKTANFPRGCFVESATPYSFTSTTCPAARSLGEVIVESPGLSLLRFEPFDNAVTWAGTLAEVVIDADPDDATNRVVLLDEQGDASFFKDIAWPSNAVEISFDYMFDEPRGEESLTVYVGDEVVYFDSADTSLGIGHLISSGPIYVGDLAGTTGRFNFVLRTDQPAGGAFGGSVLVDNLRVFGLVEGDADLDADRDLGDHSVFQNCFGILPIGDTCRPFDFDGNDTIDFDDYAVHQSQLNGPIATPVP